MEAQNFKTSLNNYERVAYGGLDGARQGRRDAVVGVLREHVCLPEEVHEEVQRAEVGASVEGILEGRGQEPAVVAGEAFALVNKLGSFSECQQSVVLVVGGLEHAPEVCVHLLFLLEFVDRTHLHRGFDDLQRLQCRSSHKAADGAVEKSVQHNAEARVAEELVDGRFLSL